MELTSQSVETLKLASILALEHFDFKGRIKQLAGEFDWNFYLVNEQGEEFILKISDTEADLDNVKLQNALMHHLSNKKMRVQLPVVLPSKKGDDITEIQDSEGNKRYMRMLSWLSGRIYATVNYHAESLLNSLGKACAEIDRALLDFDHPAAHRKFKWDNDQLLWVKAHLDIFTQPEQAELISHFTQYYENHVSPRLPALRKSVIYNDANDYNLLVNQDLVNPEIAGIIDFGDAIYSTTINELAIAIAYAAMSKPDPLTIAKQIVAGYHQVSPIQERELEVLYGLIAARLCISLTVSTLNQKERPENSYLLVSQKPGWDLLEKWKNIDPQWAHYSFREACGLAPCPNAFLYQKWMGDKDGKLSFVLDVDLDKIKKIPLNLSVGSLNLGNNSNFDTIETFENTINRMLASSDMGYGGYQEVRPFYSTDAYQIEGNDGPKWRTVHLGVDYWVDAETPVLALYDGIVHSFANNKGERNYGPTIILEHQVSDDLTFYTLYGHLSEASLEGLKVGMKVKTGQRIAWVGTPPENGNWPAHLHFQIMLDMLGKKGDFPGVGFYDDKAIWASCCPDPNQLFDQIREPQRAELNQDEILQKRNNHLGKSLSVSYRKPLKMLRGYGQYLYDHTGRRFLDTVNNVPHVGHQHPRVVRAAQKQMAVLNTNTRYLHDNIVRYAEELLATFPPELSVCHFVNSGSEANELALRMAKAYTQRQDMLVVEVGYHGNTGNCIDISSYKFDGKGGNGAPEHIHVMPIPDTYRGLYRDADAGEKYASHLANKIAELEASDQGIAGFICESILSCGGQVVPPEGYMKKAYEHVRKAGGLCIADEVQVGFGRVGTSFWAFQMHDVIPDIVTMGKPIGNGHPLAAVVTTEAVAEAFANGMEYFNTFGGNPVSCAIGREVLAVVKEEKLQQNALEVGRYLRKGLLKLQQEFPIIGDVRGPGFFQGIELVKDMETLEPAAEQASYLANRMRDHAILMSTDGPYHNVLKIKPPMLFNRSNVDFLIETLHKVLLEDFMQL